MPERRRKRMSRRRNESSCERRIRKKEGDVERETIKVKR